MNFSEWVFGGEEESGRKQTYKGGLAVSEDYVFPMRKYIEAEFLRVGGEEALRDFQNSKFSEELGEGGIGRNAKKVHRVTAEGLVRGWTANRDVWEHRMEGFIGRFNFITKGLDNLSAISAVGMLFGSEEEPAPVEVKADIVDWIVRRGWGHIELLSEIIDITGMDFDDYANALRIAEYDYHILDPLSIEQSGGSLNSPYGFWGFRHNESVAVVSDIARRIKSEYGDASETWAWVSAMRERMERREVVISDIVEAVGFGCTPKRYNQIRKSGVTDIVLIKNVLEGVLDVDLARSIQLGAA